MKAFRTPLLPTRTKKKVSNNVKPLNNTFNKVQQLEVCRAKHQKSQCTTYPNVHKQTTQTHAH